MLPESRLGSLGGKCGLLEKNSVVSGVRFPGRQDRGNPDSLATWSAGGRGQSRQDGVGNWLRASAAVFSLRLMLLALISSSNVGAVRSSDRRSNEGRSGGASSRLARPSGRGHCGADKRARSRARRAANALCLGNTTPASSYNPPKRHFRQSTAVENAKTCLLFLNS